LCNSKKFGIFGGIMDEMKCENCLFHEECICVYCEDGLTVVCLTKRKHVNRTDSCDHFILYKEDETDAD